MDKLLDVIGRHKVVVTITIMVLGLPIILAMTPLMLLLGIMWLYVTLDEAGRLRKNKSKSDD